MSRLTLPRAVPGSRMLFCVHEHDAGLVLEPATTHVRGRRSLAAHVPAHGIFRVTHDGPKTYMHADITLVLAHIPITVTDRPRLAGIRPGQDIPLMFAFIG